MNTELTVVNREYTAALGNKDTRQFRKFTTEFCQEVNDDMNFNFNDVFKCLNLTSMYICAF